MISSSWNVLSALPRCIHLNYLLLVKEMLSVNSFDFRSFYHTFPNFKAQGILLYSHLQDSRLNGGKKVGLVTLYLADILRFSVLELYIAKDTNLEKFLLHRIFSAYSS